MVTAAPAIDLKRLPLRALLAYAARCARRVRPLFRVDGNHPEMAACPRALDNAIRLTEDFAAGRTPSAESVRRAEEAAEHVVTIVGNLAAPQAAAYAANAAYAVICATRSAMEAMSGDDPERCADTAAECAGIVADAATSADPAVERAARLDWEMLHRMRLGRFPELGEPINPAESGILGPLFSGQARRVKPAEEEDCSPPPRRDASPSRATPPRPVPALPKGPAAGLAAVAEHRDPPPPADGEREKLRAEQDALRAEREKLEAERRALQAETERKALQAEQEKLRQDQESLQQERARLEENEQRLRAERETLSARVASLEQELADARRNAGTSSAELQAERAALEAERQEARRRAEQVQAELNAARQQDQEERSAWEQQRRQAAGSSDPMSELVAALQAQLDQPRHEHQRLLAERARPVEETDHRHIEPVAPATFAPVEPPAFESPEPPPVLATRPAKAVRPIPLLLEPGAATSMQVAELLYECSLLNRHLGGPGLRFAVRDARQWRLAAGGGGGEQSQVLVKIEALPSTDPGEPDTDADPVLWDQFRSCLLMTLNGEGGLADRFQQAERVDEDHHARQLVGQAVRRADAGLARYRDAHGDATSLPIDAVQDHLQKIGRQLHQLQRERCLMLELAPAAETPARPAAEPEPPDAADRVRRWSLRRMIGRGE